MSDSITWQTKFGPRRVRHDPPTIAEALVAAQGLTDAPDHQIEIAADLMGVSPEIAKAELKKLQPERNVATTIASFGDKGARTIVVERKASRRMMARPAASAAGRFGR